MEEAAGGGRSPLWLFRDSCWWSKTSPREPGRALAGRNSCCFFQTTWRNKSLFIVSFLSRAQSRPINTCTCYDQRHLPRVCLLPGGPCSPGAQKPPKEMTGEALAQQTCPGGRGPAPPAGLAVPERGPQDEGQGVIPGLGHLVSPAPTQRAPHSRAASPPGEGSVPPPHSHSAPPSHHLQGAVPTPAGQVSL